MGSHSGEVWQGVVRSGDQGTCRDSLERLKDCGNRDFIGPGRKERNSGGGFGSNGGKDGARTKRGDWERDGLRELEVKSKEKRGDEDVCVWGWGRKGLSILRMDESLGVGRSENREGQVGWHGGGGGKYEKKLLVIPGNWG